MAERSREEWFAMAEVSEDLASAAQARESARARDTRSQQGESFNQQRYMEPPFGGSYVNGSYTRERAHEALSKGEDGVPIIPATTRLIPAVRFRALPEPTDREYVLAGLIPEGCCTTLYGDGGVAKSLLAMSLGISLALGRDSWMGRNITPQSVVYLDFELSADEQHRRAKALTVGAGRSEAIPDELIYLSALGYNAEEAFLSAYAAMHEASATMLIVDSFGLALTGESESATDVIGFYRRYLQPFVAQGNAVLLVDHQAKGGKYNQATSFGSVYKRNLVRSEIQVEALSQDEHSGTLDLVLRHTKHNFGPRQRPLGAQVVFKDGEVQVNMAGLNPRRLMLEPGTEPVDRARLVFSVEDGPITAKVVADETDMLFKQARTALETLEVQGEVERTGDKDRGLPVYRLIPRHRRDVATSAAALSHQGVTTEEPDFSDSGQISGGLEF